MRCTFPRCLERITIDFGMGQRGFVKVFVGFRIMVQFWIEHGGYRVVRVFICREFRGYGRLFHPQLGLSLKGEADSSDFAFETISTNYINPLRAHILSLWPG
jgi:hypothetical protein